MLQCQGIQWQDLNHGCEIFQALCSRADSAVDVLRVEATRTLLQGRNSEGQQEFMAFTTAASGGQHLGAPLCRGSGCQVS